MDWMKKNKFLAGYLIVTILGAGALGFLAFSAKGKHDETMGAYESKLAELQGLQGQNPYPDDENLKAIQGVQKAHQAAIVELQKQLSANEIAHADITPAGFQDELNKAVRRVVAHAQGRNFAITPEKGADKFYLSFDRYQAEPPTEAAAAPLLRMLKGMEIAVTSLIDNGGAKGQLVEMVRTPIAEEAGAAPAGNASRTTGGGGAGAKGKDAAKGGDLVKRNTFSISFVVTEKNFRNFLTALTSNKQVFFIPKSIKIENQQVKGPSKLSAAAPAPAPSLVNPDGSPVQPAADPNDPAAAAAAAAATPAPTVAAEPETVNIIVGSEALQIAMEIEIADFAEPAAPKEAKK